MTQQDLTNLIERSGFHPPVSLRGFGSFFAGGGTESVDADGSTFTTSAGETVNWPQDGHFAVGQLYAQVFLPLHARPDIKLAFWHGGGMSGTQWETTPDGRQGWLQRALSDGFDCVVCDAPERGRAGVPHHHFTEEQPVFRSNELAWERFRIGPAGGYSPTPGTAVAHDTQMFPADHFEAFSKQFTARWPGFSSRVRAAYRSFLQIAGRDLVIVAHSEGALYAMECAAERPDAVLGLVLIEPAGAPQLADHTSAALAGVRVLSIWGDFINRNDRWADLKARYDTFAQRHMPRTHDVFDLNEIGLPGHSHFPMLDRGNDRVWGAVSAWIGDLAANHSEIQQSTHQTAHRTMQRNAKP